MTEHELDIEARGSIWQKMELKNGMFQLTKDEVIRRQYHRNIECSCGLSFGDMKNAKEHLELQHWIDENLDDCDDLLEVGDVINAEDESTLEIAETAPTKVKFHINGSDGLLTEERLELRERIQKTRQNGTDVTVVGNDGEQKAI